jgi:hypothetical protein
MGARYPAAVASTMSGPDRAAQDFLTDVVLNEAADRTDRLFSLRMLADEALASPVSFNRREPEAMRVLVRIAAESTDGFIRKFALLTVCPHQIAASTAASLKAR